jgi:nicotinamidase-related amidase
MPLTALDSKCALVAIDLQKGIVGMPAFPPSDGIVSRAAKLAKAFRSRNLPVV